MRFTTSAVLALAAAAALPALAAPAKGYEELISRATKGTAKKSTHKGGAKKGSSRSGGSRVGGALKAANNAVGIASGIAGIVGRETIDIEERDFIDFEARAMPPPPYRLKGPGGFVGGRRPTRPGQHGIGVPDRARMGPGLLRAREPKKGGPKRPNKSGKKGGKFSVGGALEAANNAVGIASSVAGMVGRDFPDFEERDVVNLETRLLPQSHRYKGPNCMRGVRRPSTPSERGNGVPKREPRSTGHLHAREPKKGAKKGGSTKGGAKKGSKGGRFNIGGALEAANNAVGIASGVAGMVGRDFVDLEAREFDLFGRSPVEDLMVREYFDELYSRDIEDLEARDAFEWWA